MKKKSLFFSVVIIIFVSVFLFYSYQSNKTQRRIQIINLAGIEMYQVKNTINISPFSSIKLTSQFPTDLSLWEEMEDGTKLLKNPTVTIARNDEIRSGSAYVHLKEDQTIDLVMHFGIKKLPTGYILFLVQELDQTGTKLRTLDYQLDLMET